MKLSTSQQFIELIKGFHEGNFVLRQALSGSEQLVASWVPPTCRTSSASGPCAVSKTRSIVNSDRTPETKFEKMLIGSATRYIGGRKAVQTVYWRTLKRNSEKLLKTGKHFNLKKPTVDDSHGMRMRYAGRMTDNQVCQQ